MHSKAARVPLFSLPWFSFLLGMPRIRLMILMAAKILREDVPAGKPWQQKRSLVRLPFLLALDLLCGSEWIL